MSCIKSIMRNKCFIYTLMFLFCLFLACVCKNYDYDLYARLIVGENFIEKGVFNYSDFVSYTPTHPWYDHEWGSSLVFYLMLKFLGNFGLILIQAIMTFLTGYFIIKTQRLQKNAFPVSITFMSLFFVLFVHQNPAIVRCQMFSFMFFAMFLYFLEKTRKTNSNILWLVPPITVVWSNLHGGVAAGLGLIFIYMIGELISKKQWKKYLYVLLVSVPLLLINPYGFEYVKFLISANAKTRTFITEWWNVFSRRHILYYFPQFAISVLVIISDLVDGIRKRQIDITRVLILIVTTYQGMMHVKLLSLPLIIVAALYYNDIAKLFEAKKAKMIEGITCVFLICSVVGIPFTKPLVAKTDIGKFPVKEVEFIKINNIKGNILTAFGLGSYVSYKLYPNNLIYMDGRYEEVYNDNEFMNLMHFELNDEEWDNALKKYPTEILLLTRGIPVYERIEKLKDWSKIYDGDLCGIFVKANQAQKEYKIPNNDIKYYQNNEFVNLGYFGKQ